MSTKTEKSKCPHENKKNNLRWDINRAIHKRLTIKGRQADSYSSALITQNIWKERKQEFHSAIDEPSQREWRQLVGVVGGAAKLPALTQVEIDGVVSAPCSPSPGGVLLIDWRRNGRRPLLHPAVILYSAWSPLYSSAWRTLQHQCSFLCVCVCVFVAFSCSINSIYRWSSLIQTYKYTTAALLHHRKRLRQRADDVVLSMYTVCQIVYRVGRQEIFNLSL